MEFPPGLMIKKLILKGHRKDYIIPFKEGVNVIYGDADTGKSSILRFIHYLLGAGSIKFDQEIASSVNYAILEILINNTYYCIARDIYNYSRDIDLYSCEYKDINKNYPEKLKSSLRNSGSDDKSLSEFLIDALGYSVVKLKQSPTKEDSNIARLSFLDLFKYMYLNQDDVGSTHMLNIGDYIRATKNREVFKYIFNVLDAQISELEVDISNKSKEKNSLITKHLAVAEFFSKTEFKDSENLNDLMERLDEDLEEYKNKLKNINSRIIGDNTFYSQLRDVLNTINLQISEYVIIKNESLLNIDKYTRLFNDYKKDQDLLKSSLQAKQIIGGDLTEIGFCPVCDNEIGISDVLEKFETNNEVKIQNEVNSINRRLKDLRVFIEDNTAKLREAEEILIELHSEQLKAQEIIDVEISKSITPYLIERDLIVSELAQLNVKKDKYLELLKIRNKHDETAEKIARIDLAIDKLEEKLRKLLENTPSMDDVINDLSEDLNNFIKMVKINNHYGIEVDRKSFLPKVRNNEYKNINSGGLRTIVSISYLASILAQKLKKETNIPALLMIDTVGKFLGKTYQDKSYVVNENDIREGVSDPQKYRNLFVMLIELAEKFKKENKLCQIILVDNDLPLNFDFSATKINLISFSSSGVNGIPMGLIDDWSNTMN